jgi:hypothetical protein
MNDHLHKQLTLLASTRRETAGAIYSDDVVNDGFRGVEITTNVSALPGVNEKQTVTVDAAGGVFTLTFDTEETAELDFDCTAAEMQAALEALPNIGTGNVVVTGGPGDAGGTTPYTVEFVGDLQSTNVDAMTSTATGLTGGAGTAAIATPQGGAGTSTPSFTVAIQVKDQLSGAYTTLLTSAAITALGTTRQRIYPGITAANNVALNDILGYIFRVLVTHADDDPVTYSIGAVLLR